MQEPKNNFLDCIEEVFGSNSRQATQKQFMIGRSDHWNGANVFWQVDINQQVRSGKIMLYGPNFRRIKEPFNHVHWVHSLLQKKGLLPQYFQLQQCFFGEHQLMDDTKVVAIVESAKTAVLGWLWKPNYIWLSAEGSNGLTLEKCKVLKGRKVILFPDFDDQCREKWTNIAYEMLFELGIEVSVSDYQKERNDGTDLGDFILGNPDLIHQVQYEFEDLEIFKRVNLVAAAMPCLRADILYTADTLRATICEHFGQQSDSKMVIRAIEYLQEERLEVVEGEKEIYYRLL
ncbi:hypothetical protein GCM10023331_06580 [Algivirga pacifica]|uniref:DUF6371 domain-containing protein n=1 Tax=Algivirga pacifica TaxID=1162670 RepID=A0ABP9D376_9BACT